MMLKGLTTQYLIRQTYRVKSGDTILLHAAAGGAGLILSQWAPEEWNFTVLVPFDRAEACSLKQAAERAGKSESTMRNWCVNYGIGRRVAGGVWQISKPALEMLLDGDKAALSAYHGGDRLGSVVRSYFERARIPCVNDDIRHPFREDSGHRRHRRE